MQEPNYSVTVIGRRARSPSRYSTEATHLPTEAKDISIGHSKARFLWMSDATQPSTRTTGVGALPLTCIVVYHARAHIL
jgi:hypothetical protein